MIDLPFPNQTIHEVDCFLYHPQQLSGMHPPYQTEERYFLSPANKKYAEAGQSNKVNNDGYWEPCGTESLIHRNGELIGYRKTLIYIEEKHENDKSKAEWLMHEYRLESSTDWVICKLFKLKNNIIVEDDKEATKSAAGPSDGISSKNSPIQGPEKVSEIVNDEGPSNVLHPLLDTDQVTAIPLSSSDLLDSPSKYLNLDYLLTDQETVLLTPETQQVDQNAAPTPKRPQKATKNVVRNMHVKRKIDFDEPPAFDQDFVIPHYDLPPLDASSLECSEKDLDWSTGISSFGEIIANTWHLPGCMYPLIGGIHIENEAVAASTYRQWPLYPDLTALPPLDGPIESLTEEDLAFFDKPDPGYPEAYDKKKDADK